jgi:hypothetical protein
MALLGDKKDRTEVKEEGRVSTRSRRDEGKDSKRSDKHNKKEF